MKSISRSARSLRLVVSAALLVACHASFAADQTIAGNLTVTGTVDVDGNTITFGTQSSAPGLSLTYADASADTLTFYLNRSPASFLWAHTTAIAAMRLTANHELVLYKADGTTVGLTLTPANNTISLGATTLYRDSTTGALRTNGALTVDGSATVMGVLNAPSLSTTGAINVDAASSFQQAGERILFTTANAVFIGRSAGNTSATGTDNIAVGNSALAAVTTGSFNSAVGGNALAANTTGFQNAALGHNALGSSTTGVRNTAVGQGALAGLTTGSDNVALGTRSLLINQTGNNNVALGKNAGSDATGSNNIFIGFYAASAATGSNNIAIGHSIELPSAATSNQLTIGNLIFGTGLDGTGTTLSTGNVGIGLATPVYKLDVVGDINFTGTLRQNGVAFSGGSSQWTTSGSDISFSTGNIGVGVASPAEKVDVAGYVNVDAASGYKQAGERILFTTADTVFVGRSAGNATTSGLYNTAMGYLALTALTNANENTGVGYKALTAATSGGRNSAFGSNSLINLTTGAMNTAIGRNTLSATTSGLRNTALGVASLISNQTGNENTAVGMDAGQNTTGSANTFLGFGAGKNMTAGSNNLVFGYNIDAATLTGSNQLTIGNLIFGTGVDGTGTTVSTGSVGIGTATPTAGERLEVAGNTKVTGRLTASSGRFDGPVRLAPQGDLSMGSFTSEP